jgi:hypothetical protein
MEGKLLATICRKTWGPCQYRLVEEVSVDRSNRSRPHPRREELRRHGRVEHGSEPLQRLW